MALHFDRPVAGTRQVHIWHCQLNRLYRVNGLKTNHPEPGISQQPGNKHPEYHVESCPGLPYNFRIQISRPMKGILNDEEYG